MREWNFSNGITVEEIEHDYSLHAFEVYHNGKHLGNIYPDTIEDMENCITELDAGHDPISGGWEDGLGNSCSMNGWGE